MSRLFNRANSRAGGADRARCLLSSSSSTSQEDLYLWCVATASPGQRSSIFKQAGSPAALTSRQHICACTITHAHLDVYTKTKLTFPIPPLHSLFWQWDRQARSCPLIKHTSPCLFLLVHCRCCPSKALIKTAWLKQLIKMEKLCLCHLGLELHRDSGKSLLRGRILWKESAALC